MKEWYVYAVNREICDSLDYPDYKLGGPFPNAKAAKEWMVKQILDYPALPSEKEAELVGLNTAFVLESPKGYFHVPRVYMQAEIRATKEDPMYFLSYIRGGERYVLFESESYEEVYRIGEFHEWAYVDEDGSIYDLMIE